MRARDSGPRLEMGGGRSRAALVGAAVLVHLLLFWLLFTSMRTPAVPGAASAYIAWVDIPLPQPPPPPAANAPAASLAPEAPAKPSRPPKKREVRTDMVAVPAEAAPEAPPVADVTAPEESKPAFNREAALAAARTMTHLPDPAREGTALAQFDARKMREETEQEKLGRKIAGAKRNDCIGPNASGNLLTPLMWLLDKKGSGCKL